MIRAIRSLLGGRWQLPVAVAAVIAAAVALSKVRPPEREVQFDALLADLTALMEAGRLYDAANGAANLLAMQPPLTREQQAVLHDRLAEIAYRTELLRDEPNTQNAALLLTHQDEAAAKGLRPGVRFAQRAAQAHEWLGAIPAAIESHKLVLERDPPPAVRRAALQALVRLLDGRPAAQEQRRQYIELLLAEADVSPAYVWWAIQHAVQESLDREDNARARDLLERYAARFLRSDLKGYHDYLWAWLHVSEGRYEEAAPLIDGVAQWLAHEGGGDSEMDRAGFLPALNTWLRGRIELAEGRPQEALRCFEDVLGLQTHGGLFVDATVGRTESLARLERHTAARAATRDALARLGRDAATLPAALARMRRTALALSVERHQAADADNVIGYLALALDLTPERDADGRLELLERLARESAEGAERTDDANRRQTLLTQSGDYAEQAAQLAALDPERHENLLWFASQSYDRAGRTDDARRMLAQFVEASRSDPRLPPALLQLAQACAADGLLAEALSWCQRLYRTFPNLDEAGRARLLSADALRLMGDDRAGEVEGLLRGLLEDSRITPPSQTYRDALLALCDLLHEHGRYAEAISAMEDFLRFYPDDPERSLVRFQLADAYRRSATALRASPPPQASMTLVRQEVAERLSRAARLYGDFDASSLPEGDRRSLHQRLALFYRADCLLELNEADTLDEALSLYRQAAALYHATPAALTAQVQIANVLLRQGRTTEAARAVERARWILRSIPEQAFAAQPGGPARQEWDRYLATVASSSLFRDIFDEPTVSAP